LAIGVSKSAAEAAAGPGIETRRQLAHAQTQLRRLARGRVARRAQIEQRTAALEVEQSSRNRTLRLAAFRYV